MRERRRAGSTILCLLLAGFAVAGVMAGTPARGATSALPPRLQGVLTVKFHVEWNGPTDGNANADITSE